MDALALPLFVYFLAVLAVFCVYGAHRYWTLFRFVRSGGLGTPGSTPAPARRFDTLPTVTVQLPMYNERHVADRVITAACAIDYPHDRLQIQVLDDSTDESADVARRCCERMRRAGHDIVYLHRTNRHGFKAGALAAGLEHATGEFVALFDADFVPPPGILRDVIDRFTDPDVGMVQTRWGHLNRDASLLTEIQAMCLDGHFIVEQTVRSRAGRWFNFNGTAGVWRTACIADAGGWQHDTLTEDTDLSYRAQLRGWRFEYLPHVICPAELPPTLSALMSQQHRWNKGLVQTAIKLLPRILRSPVPRAVKIEALFHLTSPVPYAAILLLSLLIAPAFLVGLPLTGVSATIAVAGGALCLALGTGAAALFSVASQTAQGHPLGRALLRVPALMAIGVGVSVLNTRAIVEAVLGRQSPFVRTPKYAGQRRSDADPLSARRRLALPAGAIEVLLGGLMLACLLPSVTQPVTLVGAPFVALFAAGYLGVGLPRLAGSLRAALAPSRAHGAESPAT